MSAAVVDVVVTVAAMPAAGMGTTGVAVPTAVAALLAAGCVGLLVRPGPERAARGVGRDGPAASPVVAERGGPAPSRGGGRRGRLVRSVLGAVAAVALLLPLGLPGRVVVLGLLGAGVLGMGTLLLRLRRAAVAAARTGERTRETCEAVADDLAAGASAERALVRATEEWADLRPVLAALRVGSDVPTAWRGVAATVPGADGLRLVAAAWQVSSRTGQGLSSALHRVAADLRVAAATRRAVDSELASARATGRLVAGLPVLAWLMGSGAGQHPLAWLLAGPVGWACLGVGLGLLLLGLAWVELLARGAVSS